ncbi:type III secretion system stalk subunit SctO [Thalassomonas actiniarum]|uniref:YscO family type III secretion system apparatus protein n=1 Tax=Thalassomonas actiniarum TaxID=485447 RepID=A0AAF0C6F5_9GAMM|nr:YscO family type III secretion system apparatus protein [Thalassomonas actiniarum]WDE02206.1 YscO family type III secretion system apparatus protein [Thalassomonas actiniarum]
MLEQIFTIKELRERKAASKVTECRRALKQHEQAVLDAKQKLKEYIQWRSQEEVRRFKSLMGQVSTYRKLELINQDISHLRLKDGDYQEVILKAEAALQQAQQALEQAKQAHVLAQRAVEKFNELRTQTQEKIEKEQQKKEELELEEFTKPRQSLA